MNTPSFIMLVEHMREKQKRYFRTRTTEDLCAAREYEKSVDSAIKEMKSRQVTLSL